MRRESSSADKSLIEAIERRSFDSFCRRVGVVGADYERLLLRSKKQDLHTYVQLVEAECPEHAPRLREMFRDRLECESVWDLLHLEALNWKRELIAFIDQNRRTLGIDYAYLQGLCSKLNIAAPTLAQDMSLSTFLERIPTLNLWETEFDAFLDGQSVVDGAPGICVYHSVNPKLSSFCDLVLPVILLRDNQHQQVRPRCPLECDAIGKETEYCEDARLVIEFILGTSPGIEERPIFRSKEHSLESLRDFDFVASAGKNFVWYHEYAHLLRGHLSKNRRQDMEYEADSLAWGLVERHYGMIDPSFFWCNLGSVILFTMFVVLETLNGVDCHDYHPSAQARLEALLKGVDDAKRDVLTQYVESIFSTLNPTLWKCWGKQVGR